MVKGLNSKTLIGKPLNRLGIFRTILATLVALFSQWGLCEELSNNLEKKAVIICFSIDKVISTGCYQSISRLERAGWNPLVIDFDGKSHLASEKIVEDIKEKIVSKRLSPTAPILVHAHGEQKGAHLLEIGRSASGSSWLDSSMLLKAIRSVAEDNPVWVSSCHSGCELYANDRCAGSACLPGEFSYAKNNFENTLDIVTDLISSGEAFEKADGDKNAVLDADEINLFFCWRFDVGKREVTRVTTLKKEGDPVREDFKETIRIDDKGDPLTELDRIRTDALNRNRLANVSATKRSVFGVFVWVRDRKIRVKDTQIENQLFEDENAAHKWAQQHIPNWPNDSNRGMGESLSISKNRRKRILDVVHTDTLIEAVLPEGKCRFQDYSQAGLGAPKVFGWQTPQLNHFRLYAPGFEFNRQSSNPHSPEAKNPTAHEPKSHR